MFAIRAENLLKKFGNIPAVNRISFDVEKGEFFGFLGPNGAGKTTTIRLLTGILTPDAGNAVIEGIDLRKNPIKAKMMMGVIPETGNVYVDLTARQNLELIGKFYGLPRGVRRKRAEEILSSLDLHERKNDRVRTFSKGMKQRVSVACATIHDPQVLFLDEPTEGLDVQSRRLVVETIKGLNERGCTVFLTTHNIEEANKLCERVCIINKGKIIAIDRPERLKSAFDETQSIEISFDRKVEKRSLISDFISRIDMYGDKWRLYTSDPDRVVKHVASLAEEEDLKITSITTHGPSLEDAFVRLTEG